MRWLLGAIVVVCLARPGVARGESFSPGDLDKQAHIAVSYSITLTTGVVLRRFEVPRWQAVAIAVASALALGTFKELVLDEEPSGGDELANGIGSVAAATVMLSFQL